MSGSGPFGRMSSILNVLPALPGDPYAFLSQGVVHSFAPPNFSCPFTHVISGVSRTDMADHVKELGDAPVSGPLYRTLDNKINEPKSTNLVPNAPFVERVGTPRVVGSDASHCPHLHVGTLKTCEEAS